MRLAAKNYLRLSENEYAIFISSIFLLSGAILAWNHEMWRDEIQAWLIARDCKTPIELIKVLKNYEGHPGLWHFGLFLLKFITYSPTIMQPYHLMVATITVYLFCRFSPFTRLQKMLFSFGYFPFYEYAIICRNYAIGMLLLCGFCTLFKSWRRKFPIIGLVLLLLAHTNVHALIIVISIVVLLLAEVLLTPDRPKKSKIGIDFALILTGIATAISQIAPDSDQGTSHSQTWILNFEVRHLLDILNIMPTAFFPIPQPTLHFWDLTA